MFYTDFFGITGMMSLFVDENVIKSLARYRKVNPFVSQSKQTLLNFNESIEDDIIFEHKEQSEDVINWINSLGSRANPDVITEFAKIKGFRNVRELRRAARQDANLKEEIKEFEDQNSIVSEMPPGADGSEIFSEEEVIILTWFKRNITRLKSLKYSDDVDEILNIPVMFLANARGSQDLYKNYKSMINNGKGSISEVENFIKKVNQIITLGEGRDVDNVSSLTENEKNFIDNLINITPDIRMDLKIAYDSIKRSTSLESLNNTFNLNLTKDEYKDIGDKFVKYGLVGFNPYTPELFQKFVETNTVENRINNISSDMKIRLEILKLDAESYIQRRTRLNG